MGKLKLNYTLWLRICKIIFPSNFPTDFPSKNPIEENGVHNGHQASYLSSVPAHDWAHNWSSNRFSYWRRRASTTDGWAAIGVGLFVCLSSYAVRSLEDSGEDAPIKSAFQVICWSQSEPTLHQCKWGPGTQNVCLCSSTSRLGRKHISLHDLFLEEWPDPEFLVNR